jgi:4-hydroxybenzoyl-CoA thioesterase
VSEPFRTRRQIRFAHCDPAGIAYYPRYLELCDGVVEDWCETVLEMPRRTLHLELNLGLPTVRMEAEFTVPSRLGDWVDFALAVTSLGRTSIGFTILATSESEPRFSIDYVQVLMDLESGRPAPWPVEWRERIERAGVEA